MSAISDSESFELFAEELTAEELPSADSYRTSTAACVGTALMGLVRQACSIAQGERGRVSYV